MSLSYLYAPVSWALLEWHHLFTLTGLHSSSGLTWALSIVCLVLTVRLLLLRFVIGQFRYQRKLQILQPELTEIRRKHKGDRARMQHELLALQRREGFNPLAGCLPALVQIPVFIALAHVLHNVADGVASHADLFGAPLGTSLLRSAAHPATIVVVVGLVVVSATATLLTQRRIRATNPVEPTGTAATVARLMQFGVPTSVVVSGALFPLGLLLYWCTSNVWTCVQQFALTRL